MAQMGQDCQRERPASTSLLPNGTLILRPKVHYIEDLVGILRRPGHLKVSIEGMRMELPDGN